MIATAIGLLLAAQASGDFLPLDPGTRWTYEVASESSQAPDAPEPGRDVTAVVRDAASPSAGGWTEVSNFLGYTTCWVRSTEAGVDLRAETTDNAPVLPLLKLPARTGEAWTGSLGKEDVAFTTGSEQTLDDGRRALRVDFSVASPEKHAGHAATRGVLWFERGTGLVRASITKDLDCHSATTTVYRLKR